MSICRFVRSAAPCSLLALGALPALGQRTDPPHGHVVGQVVDAITGAPVAAALIRLTPLHHEALTRADGRFAMNDVTPGVHTLSVQRLGYSGATQRVTVRPGETAEVRVVLEVSAVELGGIVVTGALSARSRDDVISPVTSIGGAELDRRSSQTVAGILEGTPGLAVTSLGPSTARPVIRGLGGDRILMLEDGQRTGDLSSTSSDHAVAVEPLAARQVEVVRGPMSLMYGSSALGGVVNVVRDEIPTSAAEGTHGLISLQAASVNEGLTGGGYLTTRVRGLNLRAEGSTRTFGNLATPLGTLVNTGGRTWDVAAGLGIPGEHVHGGVAFRAYANDYGIPGGFVGGHATGVDIEMRRQAVRAEAVVHRDEAFLSSIDLDGGFTHYHHSELEPSGAIGTDYDQDLIQGELVAHHGARGILLEGAAGLRGQYRDIQTGGTLRTRSTWDYSAAGFLIEEVGNQTFRLQAGLRYDHARYTPRDTTAFVTAGGARIPVRPRSFGSLSGSLGVLWMAAPVLRFGSSVSRAYRTPDFNELYSNGPHLAANAFEVGDPRIGQETGMGVDVFARLTAERVRGEISLFRNVLADYIFPSSRGRAELGTQGGRPRFQYTNEDARFSGAEAEFAVSLTDLLHLEAGGSLVNARFTSGRAPIPVFDGADTTFVPASKYPPLIPPPQGRLGLRAERPAWFAGITARGVARQDRLGDFETVTDGYALLELTAGIRVVRGGTFHTLTLRMDNALDEEYRDHLSRIKDIMPGAGRGANLMYRLVF